MTSGGGVPALVTSGVRGPSSGDVRGEGSQLW